MTKVQATPDVKDWKAVWARNEAGMRGLLQAVVQEVLEAEMTETLQAGRSERTGERLGYRSGHYERRR